MKILFVTSNASLIVGNCNEDRKRSSSFAFRWPFPETENFIREYVKELRKYAEVVCIYFHLSRERKPFPDDVVDYIYSPENVFETFSPEGKILEASASLRFQVTDLLKDFQPDVIHCNDAYSYLPFRFDKNVLYSAHLSCIDLHAFPVSRDFSLENIKIERFALENCDALVVYSDFASKMVDKITASRTSSIVLPPALTVRKFISFPIPVKTEKKEKELMVAESKILLKGKRILRVSFYGDFENSESGFRDFLFAVNKLGKSFKEKYFVEYCAYGSGKISPCMDLSLIDKYGFLDGEELINSYKKSDIVVIPGRGESYCFTGLAAMASASLVLLSFGYGMDFYAEANYNCLEIPINTEGISKVLHDAVINFDKYKVIRDNAVRSSLKWNWRRCLLSHLYVYSQLVKGRASQLSSAYRLEERKVLEDYGNASDVEKLHSSDEERKAVFKVLHQICFPAKAFRYEMDSDSYLEMVKNLENKNKRFLILTGSYLPESGFFSTNVEFFSVLNEGFNGITVRMECLPFDDREFDCVIICGAWESVIEPCSALVEAQRVSKEKVIVLYNQKLPYSWQTIQVENKNDWKKLTCKKWLLNEECSFFMEENDTYALVTFSCREKIEEKEITA